MGDSNPEHPLEVFDTLDLENIRERRLAVFALNDYYGTIFAEVGEESLEFWPRDLEKGIKHQWKKTKSRISELEGQEIPDEYDTAIESVHEIRNDVAHDFKESPPKEILERSRELAPEWGDWITEVAKEYEQHQETLTATEALAQVGRRKLEYIRDSPQDYSFGMSRRQGLLNEDAKELRKDIESASDDEEVSRELVNIISDIMELERDKEALEDEYRRRKEEAQREEEIRRAENTQRVIVTEGINDFGEIVVVTHEIGKPDKTYTIDINHSKTPEETREALAELEPDDEVHLRIEHDMVRDRKGRIDRVPYVAEIR